MQGKTLQTIAFISYLRQSRKLNGCHLVVAPLSVLFNWIAEFKKFNPSLKVQRLHTHDDDEQIRFKSIIRNPNETDVVVTTYETVKTGGFSKFLHAIVWRTVVLDEGHRIKNIDSDIAKACCRFKSRFKLILTGKSVRLIHVISEFRLDFFRHSSSK